MSRIPKSRYHKTSLSHALKRSKDRWSDYLKFVHNDIYSDNQRIVIESVIKKVFPDLLKELKLKRWKNFDKFLFRLPYCPLIENSGFKVLSSQLQKCLKQAKFKKLEVDLRGCTRMSGSGLVPLNYHMRKSLRDLNQLGFRVTQCKNISDQNIAKSSSYLAKRAPRLKKFMLDISSCDEIGPQGLKAIGNKIGYYLRNLEELSLNFSSCWKMDSDGAKLLILPISRYLRKLQNLSLAFISCHRICDQGLNNLTHYINQNLSHLKYLHLNFSGNSSITAEGFKSIMTNLNKTPQSFEGLALDFINCHFKITDMKLTSFENLQHLKHLTMNFRCCPKISDRCLKELGDFYSNQYFKNLESLCFKFFSSDIVTDLGFQALISGLTQVPDSLKTLAIEFTS